MLNKKDLLISLDFVYVAGGTVKMGTNNPTVCRLEGYKKSQTPERTLEVKPFWICKCCVTNKEFEEFNTKHHRPPTSQGDKNPVVDVTYLDAVAYANWLSVKYDLAFSLPSEPEWVLAAAPFRWEYTYQDKPDPEKGRVQSFSSNNYGTLDVDDDRFGVNYLGLYHMAGNVREITKGWYYSLGHFGAVTDGAYCITKGGDFGHCDYAVRVAARLIVDVAERSSRIGFRLAHPVVE